MDFTNALVGGVPLIFVVLGLVEWVKRLGVEGKWIISVSMVIGIVLGILYQMSVAMPADFAGWFAAGVYGLGLGVVASGVYDAIKSVQSK